MSFAYQISIRLSHSTAEILLLPVKKTNGRHIVILLLASVLTYLWLLKCHCAIKFHLNRTIRGEVMTSYRFFKMAAGTPVGFGLGGLTVDHLQCVILLVKLGSQIST